MQKVEYKVMTQREADLAVHGQEYVYNMGASYYEEDYWWKSVVMCVDDKAIAVIGQDGGEPEDQCLRRDWAWVVDALNQAYKHGLSNGMQFAADTINNITDDNI